ncbi:MAG: T9SS type A sorting domain-containing protein [Flavobacteriales bacterium]|nr:T9SS type A sorting domain-containing protein [Flavobacteriales bacterium]
MKYCLSLLFLFLVVTSQGQEVVLFSEDFANGLAGNSGLGPLMTWDSVDGDVWHLGLETGPESVYSSCQPLHSSTEENGWVICDISGYNDQFNDDQSWVEVNAWMELPAIDCSGFETVELRFEHYYRYQVLQNAPMRVEISTDNGQTWNSLEVPRQNENRYRSYQSAYGVAVEVNMNLTCQVNNADNVRIRFSHWVNSNIEPNIYFGEFWGIDDIVVVGNSQRMKLEAVFLNDIKSRTTGYQQIPSQFEDLKLSTSILVENMQLTDEESIPASLTVFNSANQAIYSLDTLFEIAGLVTLDAICDTQCPYDTLVLKTDFDFPIYGDYHFEATLGFPMDSQSELLEFKGSDAQSIYVNNEDLDYHVLLGSSLTVDGDTIYGLRLKHQFASEELLLTAGLLSPGPLCEYTPFDWEATVVEESDMGVEGLEHLFFTNSPELVPTDWDESEIYCAPVECYMSIEPDKQYWISLVDFDNKGLDIPGRISFHSPDVEILLKDENSNLYWTPYQYFLPVLGLDVDFCYSIGEIEPLKADLTNPVNNELRIRFEEEYQVIRWSIFDSGGHLLLTRSPNQRTNSLTIPTVNLPTGHYIIQCATSLGTLSEHFIVLH